jgi:uncharacterized repeat protein (TIGR04076 family)
MFYPQDGRIEKRNHILREVANMKMDESTWKAVQQHLDYNDEEMKKFRENLRNEDVLAKAPGLMDKTIVAKVVESHRCNSKHKIGDRLYFDGSGNLITKLCPKRICIYALSSIAGLIFTSNELFYAGVDPNKMRFRRAGCFDVGVQCGGWGHIVMELSTEDRRKENK